MEQKAITVSEITGYLKNKIDNDFFLKSVFVVGEVSNCKYHDAGHIYFTLKDSGAQIQCTMFAGRRTGISFELKNGQRVIVYGNVSVYEKGGTYQILATTIRLDGIGNLYEKFEALKKKLHDEGLFDSEHKKPIPAYPKKIGIVTSATGAAIQDIRRIANRRNPYVSLILRPTLVQGAGAAADIVKGIKALDGLVDVIIVGRGGGSIEDLWAFNEEAVAYAIYNCNTPVVSAVGHEIDTTIADYVSDRVASTPSAAAELTVYMIDDLDQKLALLHENLLDAMQKIMDDRKAQLKQCSLELKNNSPKNLFMLKKERLSNMKPLLKKGFNAILEKRKNDLEAMEPLLKRDFTGIFEKRKDELVSNAKRLNAVSPLQKLEKGYAYVTDINGKLVNKKSCVKVGSDILVNVTDGVITATVKDKK